jgi:S-adenosylmethionine-dependent methyltransferase
MLEIEEALCMDAAEIAAVRAYYDRQVDRAWYRPARYRLQFALTLRALRDELPAAARILDVGGGPGRYAVALAAAGHAVTLFDLAPQMLARAQDYARDRHVRLVAYVEGTATDLSQFESECFEAVLLLGPLSHLPSVNDRLQALREGSRVLVPNGLLLASFLTRYVPLRDLARNHPQVLIQQPQRYETLLETGVLPPPWQDHELPYAYYAQAEELVPLITAAGFTAPRLLSAEGILPHGDDRFSAARGPLWDAWADLNYTLAGDPGLLAAASQVLAIARRADA